MSNANAIAVEELRVGMFVQLEGGWLSHPFPLSAFKLSSPEQIDTLRRLGLGRVQWVPEKSDWPVPQAVDGPVTLAEPAPAPDGPTPAEVHAQRLQVQRSLVQHCEGQRNRAETELRQLLSDVTTQPQAAGRATVALTQALLNDMLNEEEVGIRLVGGSSDRELSHALNVSVIALLIGRMLGMAEADLLDLGVGALLHDAGKQAMAPRHRQWAEGQSPAELQAYRDHVSLGVHMGQQMGLSAGALAVLAQHHEQADGGGFPRRLTGDQISLPARVVCIVNRYDGLCNPYSGAPGLTPHEAVAMLFAQHRHRFDSTVLNAFIRMMGVYPAGSIVQLTDDRYALVVGANSSRPLKPRVLVFDPSVARAHSLLLNLEHVRDLGIRRSLHAQRLPADALHYLNPRTRVAYYFEPLASEGQAAAAVS